MNTANFSRIQILLFISLVSISVSAQKFDSLLNKLDAEYPQEKIYCQFDKTVYNPGETIWFKAYLFAGNNISLISKTIYADLLDDKGKLIERKTAPVIQSSGASYFTLPDNFAIPVVYVKVYTKWMLNFDSGYLFVKAIPVIVSKKGYSKSLHNNPQVSLQFFPESGDLVEGVESRLAFKAAEKKGLPSNVSGEVYDSKLKKVASFSSVHDGMGYFIFIPGDDTYTAKWKDGYGQKHETILPASKKSGVVLEVNNAEDNIEFTVKRSADVPEVYSSVSIVGQMQQQMLFTAKANFKAGNDAHGKIDTKDFPPGIAQITVFDNNGKPIAERLVFLHQQESYFITDLNPALKDMTARKKNVIQIDVPDSIICNLSVAVTDASTNPTKPGDDNIFSHILLTGDIRGYVHNPGYYFTSDADSVIANLDLVMMTNGWRRFKWENVLSGNWPQLKYSPDNYISLQGKIVGLSTIQLTNKDLTGIFEQKNGSKNFINIPVKKDGNFSVPGMIFYDTAKLYYQFNGDKDKTLTSSASFQMSSNFLKEKLSTTLDSMWLTGIAVPDSVSIAKNRQASSSYLADREALSKVKVLSTVIIKARQRSKNDSMDAKYTSGFFTGGDGNTFILDGDPLANLSGTVLSYLQAKVAGLVISINGSDASITWRGATPSIYLNEIEDQVQDVQSIPLSDVAMIKVFRPPFFGPSGGGSGGAIAVYLKKGSRGKSEDKGLDFSNIVGYSPIKEFYSPDYSLQDQPIDKGDYRTTLYWNPYVFTDKTHRRVLLPFYNNDITKKMKIIIEGCNANGTLTRVEKIFQ